MQSAPLLVTLLLRPEPTAITCADCGTTQTLPRLPLKGAAHCVRCDRRLERRVNAPLDVPIACAAAIVVLLPPAAFLPLMYSTIQNLVFDQSRLVSSVATIYREVWFPFAFGFLFFAFLFPWLRAILLLVVFGTLRAGKRFEGMGRVFRWSEELRIWSMTDVVVIAGIVAYLRAGIPADVRLLEGAWMYLFVATLEFAVNRTYDRRAVWNAIYPDCAELPPPGRLLVPCARCEIAASARRMGDPCPRCGAVLEPDIALRFAPVIGAVAAAIPLSLPAYSFSIMVNDQISAVIEHTIIGTVQLFADRGYWQFSIVMLLAGVVIPLAVLAGMIWLLLRVRFPSRRGLVLRTRVYRAMHRLMRWPMIIPFIAAIAAPIVDFRGIDDIVAGPGATPLFMLIALLMLAVRLFEPRLMWRTAGEQS